MAKRRLSMRKIKEVLRLKWDQKLTNRQIAKSCSISHTTVREYHLRAELAGLSWPLDPKLDDAAIEYLLFPRCRKPGANKCQMPNMKYLYEQLKEQKPSPPPEEIIVKREAATIGEFRSWSACTVPLSVVAMSQNDSSIA